MDTKIDNKGKTAFYAALAKAQYEVGPVGRDSRNDYHGFSFTSTENMILHAKDCLLKHGLVPEVVETMMTTEGGVMKLKVVFECTHAETGFTKVYPRELPIVPGKGRPDDKASLTSETSLYKYWFRGLLAVPMLDEEVCARDDSGFNATRDARQPVQSAAPTARAADRPKPEPTGECVPVIDTIGNVVEITRGTGQYGECTLWGIDDSKGVRYATFKPEHRDLAEEAMRTDRKVQIDWSMGDKGARIDSISFHGQAPKAKEKSPKKADAQPQEHKVITTDDIPF